jgi:alanine racemase
MTISRRDFITSAVGTASAVGLTGAIDSSDAAAAPSPSPPPRTTLGPWLEIDPAALAHNVATIASRCGNRPVLAVAKNNAYGCGLATAGPMLDKLAAVWGLAVVRPEEAFALRDAGVKKPVLLMGPATDDEALALARRGVRLAPYSTNDATQLTKLASKIGRPIPVHVYVDTGMHRMGMPHDRVVDWLESSALRRAIRIEGAFTELVEDQDFDREQALRMQRLAERVRAAGLSLGRLHGASSDAIMRPTAETFLDVVRPGLSVYGGYPTDESMARAELRCAYRLKARVIRVDQLAPGEGVSYHRRFTATEPTATATLAVGHVDGYPSGATKGCEIQIGGVRYPVVGTVSASHTVVSLGPSSRVKVGDEAILVGPDHPSLHPNEIAKRSGWSEYNMFMHLNPMLPRIAGAVQSG